MSSDRQALRGLCALVVCGLLFPPTAAWTDDLQTPTDDARVVAARAAATNLGMVLKEQLFTAIAANGTAAAVDACKAIAPAVTGDISEKRHTSIRRTALKVRNPDNAPDAFERKVLDRFLEQINRGSDPATLEYTEITTEGHQKRFRYMKAIPMAEAPCQACHGATIAPDVAERIRILYPDDQATGFAPGTLRGAFSVSEPWE